MKYQSLLILNSKHTVKSSVLPLKVTLFCGELELTPEYKFRIKVYALKLCKENAFVKAHRTRLTAIHEGTEKYKICQLQIYLMIILRDIKFDQIGCAQVYVC